MKTFYEINKRFFDILGSSVGIILFSPIMICVFIAIKLDSKGPVLFLQERLGKNGSLFRIIKFRSMVVNAEHMDGGIFNTKNDSRVTRVGKFIRNTSLDELPQFFNILIGDMSFVGPRPPVKYELGDYENWSKELKLSFSIKPGVTGLAQVSGRNELSWDEKTKFNLTYLKRRSFFYDLYLIFLTLVKVLKNEGSHELESNIEIDKKRLEKNKNEIN